MKRFRPLGLFIAIVCLSNCKEPYLYYTEPEWLGGDHIETLVMEGRYSHFLALMDRAGYTYNIQNQLYALFVPDDEAFERFFANRGINSVDELSEQEALNIFTLHALINPRSRQQLIYESGWELETPTGEWASLFHRKKTFSEYPNYTDSVYYFINFKGSKLSISGGGNVFVPLFTTEYINDIGGVPEDYLFMYPGSNWSGTQWHSAMVTDAEVRTASGFIYYIDRVLDYMPTIDRYLAAHPDSFGLFYTLLQRFANYTNPTLDSKTKQLLSSKSYINIIGQLHNPIGSSSTQAPSHMLGMATAFVPYNHVLQEYLNHTALKYYSSIDEIPDLFLEYLLNGHLDRRIRMPSIMARRFHNYFGDPVPFNPYVDINHAFMCNNGIVYSMNRIIEPRIFQSVVGPLLYNANYLTYLRALNLEDVNLLGSLSNPENIVTLFLPSDSILDNYGYRTDEIEGNSVIQRRGKVSGLWNTISNPLDVLEFVQDHMHYGMQEDISGEGFLPMVSGNHLYYNNGKLYAGGNMMGASDAIEIIESIPSEVNGIVHFVNNALKTPPTIAELIESQPELSSFYALLQQAELTVVLTDPYDTDYKYPQLRFANDAKQWTVLAPSNAALANAQGLGLIPAELEELRAFIHYHFVKGRCVFDDGMFSGELGTSRITGSSGGEAEFASLSFNNAKHNLKVTDHFGQTITIPHATANRLARFSVVHIIDNVIRYE